MKVNYKGYLVEGMPDEIRLLLNIRKPYKKHRKKGQKLFVMTEAHKDAIRKAVRRHWRLKRKGNRD